MDKQEEIWEKNRFNELNHKYRQALLIAEERIKHLDEKVDLMTGKIKHYETLLDHYTKLMKGAIREANEARSRLIEAGEGANKDTLDMIKELGILINKWRGDDF